MAEVMSLLIVDDRQDNLLILSSLVSEYFPTIKIFTAPSAADGIKLAIKRKISVALIDVQMPEMDGIEMCRQLKIDPRTRQMALILLTSHSADPGLKAKGLEAGADDFINRPFDNSEFVARVKVMLRIKRAEDDLSGRNQHLEEELAVMVTQRTQELEQELAERKQVERALTDAHEELNRSSEFLSRTSEMAKVGGWEFDLLNNKHYWTQETYRIHEIDPSLEPGLDMGISCYAPDAQQKVLAAVEACSTHGTPYDLEVPFITATGRHIWVRTQGFALTENGKVSKLRGSFQDITDRKRTESALRESEEQHRSILYTAMDGFWRVDMQGQLLEVNMSYCRMSGYSEEELLSMSIPDLEEIETSADTAARIQKIAESGEARFESRHRRKDGSSFAVQVNVQYKPENGGNMVVFIADITQSKKYQEKLDHMAHFDMLTGLPNRALFIDRFQQTMAQSKRAGNQLAICFLDLDNFKPINDGHGHNAGDQILIEVAQRIKTTIREGDTVSRQGGDEFALLLSNIESASQYQQLLDRILHSLSQAYIIDGYSHYISASIGLTLYPLDDSNLDTLLRHADIAMYEAKVAGKNQHRLFSIQQDQKAFAKHHRLDEIKHALVNNEFCFYYQPKVNMLTGDVFGAEALIRWQHPDKGLIPPLEFLPIIDGTQLELEIGEWVINEALAQLDAWQKQSIQLEVSINISSNHLLSNNFFSQLEEAFAKHTEVDSARLQLEILESSELGDVDTICDIIKMCQDTLGCNFALDDFGTGYSSLTHLRNLPINTIKIDQTFVRDMLVDTNDKAIIEGVIGLADAFHRKVIAEGVETTEHGQMLIAMGCEEAQGYGIAKPMPAKNIPNWLSHYIPNKDWLNCVNQHINTKR